MKTRMKRAVTGFIIGLVAETPAAYAACEDNVDNVEAYYVNGMFTDFSDFEANRQAISKFISGYLAASNFNSDVKGTHNISEGAYNQVMEVAKQKTEDGNATKKQAVLEFINGDYDYLNSEEGVAAVQEYLEAIKGAYEYTLNEEDGLKAKQGLEELLDTCSRVVMITHSQGNFYGNALLNGVYASYHFPNGYALAQFPMLGNMQIASPVNVPGGAAASLYPELIGHLTNDNDLVMRLVRSTRGSVPSNFNAPDIEADKSGHSLEQAYLTQHGQAGTIATRMYEISRSFKPYPLHGQSSSSSSALSGFGYSSISRVLDISFNTGGVYRYHTVDDSVFNGLQNASSQGTFFNSSIRGNYSFTQLE